MNSNITVVNPTRVIGLSAYIFSIGCCAVAWVKRDRATGRRWLLSILASLEAALLLDMVFSWRWLLHNWLADAAKASNLYGERSGPQHFALIVLACSAAAGIVAALWLFRWRAGAALATCAGLLSIGLWCVEVVSLHAVDGVLYQRVEGVMIVRLACAGCACLLGLGILWDAFATRGRDDATKAVTF